MQQMRYINHIMQGMSSFLNIRNCNIPNGFNDNSTKQNGSCLNER